MRGSQNIDQLRTISILEIHAQWKQDRYVSISHNRLCTVAVSPQTIAPLQKQKVLIPHSKSAWLPTHRILQHTGLQQYPHHGSPLPRSLHQSQGTDPHYVDAMDNSQNLKNNISIHVTRTTSSIPNPHLNLPSQASPPRKASSTSPKLPIVTSLAKIASPAA